MLNWFRRKGARPKPGRRAAPPDGPGARRDSHRPTELIDVRRDDARGASGYPPAEPFSSREPEPAPPRDWAPAGRPSPPPSPSFGPPKPAAPSGSNATVMIDTSQAPRGGDIAAVLVGINGPLKNRVYPIFDQENHLGRAAPGKDGVFDKEDETISRDHGKLRLDEGSFHIRPMSEKTPISVNSERLSEDGEMLRDGDTIQMGQTTFRFKVI